MALENTSHFFNESESCETPLSWASVMIVANLLSTIVGAIGNILVCVAVWKTASLHSTINYHMVSLAIADLFVTVLVQPLMVVVIMWRITGDLECSNTLDTVYRAIGNFSCCASFLNLCSISFERFLAVVRPFGTYKNTKSKRFIILLLAAWLVSLAYSVLRVTSSRKGTSYFSGAIFGLGYIWMVSCYAVILVFLGIQAKRRMRSGQVHRGQGRGERKITVTMIFVIICFTVMWLPFFYFRLSGNPSLNSGFVYELAITLALCNSSLNPIIYSFRSRNYRNAFKSIMLKRHQRLATQSTQRTTARGIHEQPLENVRQTSSGESSSSASAQTEPPRVKSDNKKVTHDPTKN